MKLRNALLAATVLAAPVAVKAQTFAQPYSAPISGLYVGLGAGVNFLQDETISQVQVGNRAVATGGNAGFNDGFTGLGNVGWGFGNGLRAEIEGDYQTNKLQSVAGAAIAGGNQQKYGVMVNALYDFNEGWPVTPYVGVGIGWQQVGMYSGRIQTFNPNSFTRIQNSSAEFGYQAILGVSYNLPIPGLALTAEYRFLGIAGNPDLKAQVFGPGVVTSGKIKFSDIYTHNILVGVRYAFNAAPPPPPPAPAPVVAPAPAPARSYLVFFDWDRADLTDRARQVIAEAAQNSTHVQYTRIEVNGYTDTSGSAAYNLRLSVRRARAVEAELVRNGVPQNVIDIHGFGETHLLVPTGPGVREPQNRRVEIILQ
jgi:OmpA-OmpF porin, OOP family